ncbi:MATE family efflux transporter [Brachyspira hampsonii]|uniref:MATE family efflux transporter n=1 Tax=Brachyspira hampsonii TaxID=1287055 RepID=UPI001C66C044|nr:MATE family efflux transporter [Brachyspira hampsonii]MBW5388720.1 MATE family efflux transporter [Brachyspira hampsonii]
MHNNIKNLIKDSDYIKILIPFVISTMTQPLLGAVDTAVAGRLGNPAYIAGVSVGSVIFNTIYWVFGFLRVNTTSFSAMALGTGKTEDRAFAFFQPLYIALFISFLILIFQKVITFYTEITFDLETEAFNAFNIYYNVLIWGAPFLLSNYVMLGWLMGQRKIKASLTMQISGNVLNMILDVFFAITLSMGVFGIAAATLISQISSFLIGIFFIIKYGNFGKIHLKDFTDLSKMKKSLISNLYLMLRTICLIAQINIFTSKSASLGTILISSNSILLQIQSIISYMFDGIANTSSVYSGKAFGAKDQYLLKAAIMKNIKYSIIFIILLTALYLIFNKTFINLFTDNIEVLSCSYKYYFWVALYPIVSAIGLTFYGIFTGASFNKAVFISTFLSLLLFLFVLFVSFDYLNNNGLWIALLAFYFGRSIFILPFIKSLFKKINNN